MVLIGSKRRREKEPRRGADESKGLDIGFLVAILLSRKIRKWVNLRVYEI